MAGSVVVIGGAGLVGRGVASAFRDAGYHVLVVDPEAGDEPDALVARADEGLLERLRAAAPVRAVVVSLPTRGQGRPDGDFRPSAVAAEQWGPRLSALELATGVLADGGALIELAGSTALAPGTDEAGFVAAFQRGVHEGLAGLGRIRRYLCAIHTRVRPASDGPHEWPSAEQIGVELVELCASERPRGLCRIAAPTFALEWVDGDD